jgi:hypothetical protein
MNLLYVRPLTNIRRRTARKKGKNVKYTPAVLPLFCIQYADIYHREEAEIKQKLTFSRTFETWELREKTGNSPLTGQFFATPKIAPLLIKAKRLDGR